MCVCVCVCICSSGRLNLVWGISVCSTNLARRALLLARRALNVRWNGRGNEKMEKRKDVKRKVESVTFLVRVSYEIKKK